MAVSDAWYLEIIWCSCYYLNNQIISWEKGENESNAKEY